MNTKDFGMPGKGGSSAASSGSKGKPETKAAENPAKPKDETAAYAGMAKDQGDTPFGDRVVQAPALEKRAEKPVDHSNDPNWACVREGSEPPKWIRVGESAPPPPPKKAEGVKERRVSE